MCGLYLSARAVLALLTWQLLAGFEEITKKNVLTITEEWSNVDGKQNWCQLNLSTHLFNSTAVCVRVRLRVEPLVAGNTLLIEFADLSSTNSSILISNQENRIQWRWLSKARSRRVDYRSSRRLSGRGISNVRRRRLWELQFDCFKSQAGRVVLVSVHDFNRTCRSSPYIVQHMPAAHCKYSRNQVPNYKVTVDASAKLFKVDMDTGQVVKARLCYKNWECSEIAGTFTVQNTDLQPAVNLSFPHLVPCVCLQVYGAGVDVKRVTTCPFEGKTLPGGGDVLSSSTLKPDGRSGYEWKPLCLFDSPKPTVSLCWKHQENSHCFPLQNITLQDRNLKYNMTDVDRHTNMCVKFTLNDSHRVFCPFTSGLSEWEVVVVPGSQCLRVYLSSGISASFAAQLCEEEKGECVGKGNVHSVQMEESSTEVELKVPLPFFRPGLCVQVWRSEPDLRGIRIICPDYKNRKWGLVVSGSLVLLVILVTVGLFTYMLIKQKTSVWRCAERKPVLLVCSSEDVDHVAAMCALASGLQEELRIDVRLAQWALCSTRASLAQLGPAPWLYGQWQEVQQAGGVVLLAWSLEAQQAFLRWRELRECERWKGQELKCKDWTKRHLEKQKDAEKEMSSITAPVFNATLSCLWAGLHGKNSCQGFGLVCFRGLGNSCHIPKDLRGIRRFCLPRDLSNLVHELDLRESSPEGGVKEVSSGWCCWSRLFSKALSLWLSQRLAQRLEVLLPQIDSKEKAKMRSKNILKLSWKTHNGKKIMKKKKKKKKLFFNASPQ
ncbi:interleukin-17 receptor E [Astyanax mexicanus]|uniref:interleukin-17 receptor E n=1 Tax=Astyanax mexicanus TaxID=7994 RepID=UPI0020CAFD1A|nr:interleukin-17 receptor E [Astyanax mexicanus]